jgi:hypothetical protein
MTILLDCLAVHPDPGLMMGANVSEPVRHEASERNRRKALHNAECLLEELMYLKRKLQKINGEKSMAEIGEPLRRRVVWPELPGVTPARPEPVRPAPATEPVKVPEPQKVD